MSEISTTKSDALAISMSDVIEAMGRIRDHVHCTPVMECSYLNVLSGLQLFFKCELFQKTGSFKVILLYFFYFDPYIKKKKM